jgi:peroxiredoxin
MAIAVGTSAPDFTAKNTAKQDVTISSHKGKDNVVLLFFPFAFSPICSDELCGLRDGWSDFNAPDAVTYGISVDSPHALWGWREKEKFPFDFLSDFNKEISRAYGVLHETLGPWKGVSKRSAIVIGKDGNIAYAWSSDDPKVKPDMAAIRNAVQALK